MKPSERKPPAAVRVGMLADDVLKMRGRDITHSSAPPQWVKYGTSVKWYYADCSVLLARDGEDGPYRVIEVTETEGEDDQLPTS